MAGVKPGARVAIHTNQQERGWRIYYALFSRSGFTQSLLYRAQADPEILLFDPTMVISAEA